MGVAKLRLCINRKAFKIKTKLLAISLLSLPEGTSFVGVENHPLETVLLLENPLFIDGSELIASFERSIAVINDKIIDVDHFQGMNLSECLVNNE